MLPSINFEKCPSGNIQTFLKSVSAFKESLKLPISLEQKKINHCFPDSYPRVTLGTVAGYSIVLHPKYIVWLGGRREECSGSQKQD